MMKTDTMIGGIWMMHCGIAECDVVYSIRNGCSRWKTCPKSAGRYCIPRENDTIYYNDIPDIFDTTSCTKGKR